MNEALGIFQLIVVDNGIDSDIDLGIKLMGIVAELTDIVNTIACSYTGTKLSGTNIDGISAMVNGRYATLQILGRSQQFEFCKR